MPDAFRWGLKSIRMHIGIGHVLRLMKRLDFNPLKCPLFQVDRAQTDNNEMEKFLILNLFFFCPQLLYINMLLSIRAEIKYNQQN